jgi:alpha-L-fucosidase
VVIQYKYEAFRPGTAVFDIERGALDGIHPRVWQNDTSVSRNSWSWIEGHDYKTAPELIAEHGEAIYGTRPWTVAAEGPSEQRSGYFTDASSTRYTSADLRFTHRKGVEGEFLYATALDWPADGRLRITSLGRSSGLVPGEIGAVEVLGHSGEVTWTRDTEGLHVQLPTERPSGFGVTVRVHLTPRPPAARRAGFHP